MADYILESNESLKNLQLLANNQPLFFSALTMLL